MFQCTLKVATDEEQGTPAMHQLRRQWAVSEVLRLQNRGTGERLTEEALQVIPLDDLCAQVNTLRKQEFQIQEGLFSRPRWREYRTDIPLGSR